MSSPMQSSPMSGGMQQNNPMGYGNNFAQNIPAAGGQMGGQQPNPMSGGQQFGGPPTFNGLPMGGQPNTFNPYMGGATSSNMSASAQPYSGMPSNIAASPSAGSFPMQGGIGSLQSQPSYPQRNPYAQNPLFAKQQEFQNQMQAKSSEVMNSIPEYQQLQKMQQQLQGRQPSAQEMQQLQALSRQIQGNSGFQQLQQQQQQMGQQLQQQYGNQLAELQAKDRQYNMQQQQAIDKARGSYGRQQAMQPQQAMQQPKMGFLSRAAQKAASPYTPINPSAQGNFAIGRNSNGTNAIPNTVMPSEYFGRRRLV